MALAGCHLLPLRCAATLTIAALLSACALTRSGSASRLPEAPMIAIPAGWFWMGADTGPPSCQPRRLVFLDAYEIDRTEVTNSAFAAFLDATGWPSAGWDPDLALRQPDHPVVGVRWRDADAYCRWSGKSLPTEAQWERAARGEDGRAYPWGEAWDPQKANTAESGREGVAPVGSYPAGASPAGVLDMAGNAAEWVADYYDPEYYQAAPDRNPAGPSLILDHGLRGGSWASSATQARTYMRDASHSVSPNPRVGFRCARSLPGPP